MKKFPNKVKFTRPHKIKIIKGYKGMSLNRFTVGVRLKTSVYISYDQLEATRRIITRLVKPKEIKNKRHLVLIKSAQNKKKQRKRGRPQAKQKRFFFIRSNLCLPLTKKPLQVRMGKGKGTVNRWVYAANKLRIIFEMSRQRFKLRKIYRLFTRSRIKLPSKIKITYDRKYARRESNFVNITEDTHITKYIIKPSFQDKAV